MDNTENIKTRLRRKLYYIKNKAKCNEIIKQKKIIHDELISILKNNTEYKYNGILKESKMDKHFYNTDEAKRSREVRPNKSEKNIIEHCKQHKKSDDKQMSFCTKHDSFVNCINIIISAINCRFNYMNYCNNCISNIHNLISSEHFKTNPKFNDHTLTKTNIKNELIKKFPEFYDKNNDRIHHDCIFEIYTENPHYFIDFFNNKSKLCDIIQICLSNKTKKYNIFFKSSKHLDHFEISNIMLESLCNSKPIRPSGL
jgi:hypothetical protein